MNQTNQGQQQLPIQSFEHLEKIRTVLKRSGLSYDDVLEAEKAIMGIREEVQAFVSFVNSNEAQPQPQGPQPVDIDQEKEQADVKKDTSKKKPKKKSKKSK